MTAPKRNLVSAKETLIPLKGYVNLKDLKKGDSVGGIYLGFFISGAHNTKTHKFQAEVEVPVTNKDGEELTALPGELFGIGGNASLDKQIAAVKPGAYAEVVYNGRNKMKSADPQKNGKLAYDVTVNYDADFDPADAESEDSI